jgi:hypothetical protein
MTDELPAQWGILELMGHKAISGKISEIGKPLIRIDVPETSRIPAFTQFYGEKAIYCITMTSEEVARKCAEDYEIEPISVYAPSLIDREKYDEACRDNDRLQDMLREEQRKRLPKPNPDDLPF